MNLKTTIQTLRRIEQLLDGWQSSGEIPAIERDWARDLLRRAYEDILLAEKVTPSAAGQLQTGTPEVADVADFVAPTAAESAEPIAAAAAVAVAAEIAAQPAAAAVAGAVAERAAESETVTASGSEVVPDPILKTIPETASEAVAVSFVGSVVGSVAEPTAENTEEESATEPVGEIAESPAGKDDAPVAGWVSPIGLVGIASPEDSDEEAPEEPAEEHAPAQEFAETAAERDFAAQELADSAEEGKNSVEEFAVNFAAENTPAEVYTGNPAEETAAEESTGAIPFADVTESSAVEALTDSIIPPAIEIVAENTEAAEDTEEIEEEAEPESESESEPEPEAETETEAASPVAAAVELVAATVGIAAEPEPEQKPDLEAEPELESESVAESAATASAPMENPAGEAPANAAISATETLEEMASRFKSVSGRRRKSRRALFSLYDDDETARREEPNGQLELSGWGIEPSEPSSKIKHVRELFGLPVDDLDAMSEPTAQPVADTNDDAAGSEFEIEIADFTDTDPLLQRGQSINPVTSALKSETKPAAESAKKPEANPATDPTAKADATQTAKPTAEPDAAPAAEPAAEPLPEEEEADEDLSFDEAVVALDDFDDAPSTVTLPDPSEKSVPAASDAPAAPEKSTIPETPAVPETFGTDDEPIEPIEELTDEESEKAADNETGTTDNKTIEGYPTDSVTASPRTPAAEPANVRGLFGREEKPEMPGATTVLGEVIGNDRPTVGDSLGHRPDVAEWVGVADDLNRAISVGERFVLLRDLFGGDQALCDRTLKRLSTFDDLDDCMIWITENFAWNANSEGAKLIMRLLERKMG